MANTRFSTREREGEKEKGVGRELKGGKKKEKECGDKEEA